MIKCSHDELVKIGELKPHPDNPNSHDSKQIKLLAKIMKHQGWRNPITVSNQSGFIVTGHGRLLAAKKNKDKVVPVDYQDFDNDGDECAHMIADNKLAELAELDLGMVGLGILDLGPDFDLELLGIPGFEADVDGFSEDPKEKELDEGIHTDSECPSCGYKW